MGLYVVRVDGVKFDHHSSTYLMDVENSSSTSWVSLVIGVGK